jgi:hypothetical protein
MCLRIPFLNVRSDSVKKGKNRALLVNCTVIVFVIARKLTRTCERQLKKTTPFWTVNVCSDWTRAIQLAGFFLLIESAE